MSISLYDTTLRDGAQQEGISLSLEDKLKITLKLDELGVHYIEGGTPGSNPKDAAVQLADVMNHEVVHALKALGLISEADMAVLMRFVKRKQTSGPMKGVSYYDEVMASGYADHYNDAWMEENNIPPESRDQAREGGRYNRDVWSAA